MFLVGAPPLVRMAPGATAPAALAADQWTAANAGTGGALTVEVVTPPDTGGSPITAYQYRLDGGAPTAFSPALAAPGARTISGLGNDVALDVQVRAVNAIGDGSWSDVKTRTPTASFLAPTFVGASSAYIIDGAVVDYALALPTGAQAGDLLVVSNPRAVGPDNFPVPPAGAAEIFSIGRLNSSAGSNYNWGVWGMVLTAGDISAGHVVVPRISNATAVGALAFRNASAAVVRTTHYRSAGLEENSVTLRQETPVTGAPSPIAVALAVRGGGLRETTFPVGWTSRLDVMDPVYAGPNRFAVHACTQVVGGASPADELSFSGAADLCITTLTLIVEGVAT